MNFLDLFNDVVVTPVMLTTKVENVKLKPASNSMQVTFSVPNPLSEEEKASRHILGRLYGPIATTKEKTRKIKRGHYGIHYKNTKSARRFGYDTTTNRRYIRNISNHVC